MTLKVHPLRPAPGAHLLVDGLVIDVHQ